VLILDKVSRYKIKSKNIYYIPREIEERVSGALQCPLLPENQ
jgi:hypothetical protein